MACNPFCKRIIRMINSTHITIKRFFNPFTTMCRRCFPSDYFQLNIIRNSFSITKCISIQSILNNCNFCWNIRVLILYHYLLRTYTTSLMSIYGKLIRYFNRCSTCVYLFLYPRRIGDIQFRFRQIGSDSKSDCSTYRRQSKSERRY